MVQTRIARLALFVVPVVCVLGAMALMGQDVFHSHEHDLNLTYKAPSSFSLPGTSVDAGLILGKSPGDVRHLMGPPASSTETADTFRPGPDLIVKYRDGVAKGVIVSWPEVARHERYVRRWLHLPGDGPMLVGGFDLRIETFVGDDNRIGVEIFEPPQARATTRPVAHHAAPPPAAPPGKTIELLLHAFPALPENFRNDCNKVSAGLTCPGFDGGVRYDLSPDESPLSLTIVDTREARTEEECQALLSRIRTELKPKYQHENREGRRTIYFTSPDIDGIAVWKPAKGFEKATSCSVMLCRKTGARTSCSP